MRNEPSWPEQRRELLQVLSDGQASADDAVEAVGSTVDSLQRWKAARLGSGTMLSGQVDLICARFGYMCLTGVTVPAATQCTALNEHFRKLIVDLVAIVTEVEHSEADLRADAVESS
jgi:hypothetical protein